MILCQGSFCPDQLAVKFLICSHRPVRTRGDMLRYAIAYALIGARKLVHGLRVGLTEDERYRVADDVVYRLKQYSDPWRLPEEPPIKVAREQASCEFSPQKNQSER